MKNSLPKKKVLIIHPGTQHLYRLANALSLMPEVKKVKLYTWFLLSENNLFSQIPFLKKRVKSINKLVSVYNYPIFEIFLNLHLRINTLLKYNKGFTTRYKWQVLFGYLMLPLIFFNRKNSILIVTETCGWPITKYAKRWNIPVVMDFPSISHEEALKLGIEESNYGIKIKELERQYIDYAISCSSFAKDTYSEKTSAKKHFVIWLGANLSSKLEFNRDYKNSTLNICCLANTEKRKGLDVLLNAFNKVNHPNKKLFLIGKIDKHWVDSLCLNNSIDQSNIYLTGPIPQQDLADFLINKGIDLHILPSRFDSFGMVVPETMSLNIPNILSPYVGAGEMLENEVDSYILKILDTETLIHSIKKFISLSEQEKEILKQKVSEKSKQMTWKEYDYRVHTAFKEILSESL